MFELDQHSAKVGNNARIWCIIPMIFGMAACYATLFEQSINSPLFRQVQDMAPYQLWGAWWAAIVASSLITFRYGFVWSYMLTNLMMVGITWLWGGSVLSAKLLDQVDASWMAPSLWGFVANVSLFVSFVRFDVIRPEQE